MADKNANTFLAKVCKGRTFADVGGIWGTVNEKASIAYQHGASEITMIDIFPSEHELWKKFHERMESMNIKEYKCVIGDIIDLSLQSYEVIHSSGVLYHIPDPLKYVYKLSSITKEYLVLGSQIIIESIENQYSSLKVPKSGALFVPALNDADKDLLTEHWRQINPNFEAFNRWKLKDYHLKSYGPWWWLPTVNTLKMMCRINNFEIIDECYGAKKHTYTLLLKKVA